MKYTPDCDVIVTVGSGVLNDIGKIVANTASKPCIIVGTAPSMDGYASASSSMEVEGLKVTLASKCPDVIIGDLDILSAAPTKMMVSGLGDMLAKYVSICEWRISHLINGEYYCERVAELVRTALKKCVDNSDGLLKRDREAVRAVFEGLVIGGAAMKYAGISRPASGVEHYISHVWDMRGAEFGLHTEFHGLQCAVGTLIAARVYEKLLAMTPDREKALRYAESFDFAAWSDTLRAFLGKGAESMIAQEAKEQKYNVEKHHARLEKILANWEEIRKIAAEELPSAAALEALMERLGAPMTPADLGVDPAILPMTFRATKDIRDKYVLSRLCWDLGVLDEII
jgi:glycerol-1-phosphate dehydrogenase [NAD(P)+]